MICTGQTGQFDCPASRLAGALEGGVFPIQGPPGAGKTHIGARMICTLAASGKTVGITANSHKVIRNLLDETLEAAAEQGLKIQCVQKVSEEEPDIDGLSFVTQNDDALSAIGNTCHVAAGTAWLFAHDGLQNQRIVSGGPASGSGLRFFPVVHQGNQSSSPEEADAIRDLVSGILGVGGTWIDRDEVRAASGGRAAAAVIGPAHSALPSPMDGDNWFSFLIRSGHRPRLSFLKQLGRPTGPSKSHQMGRPKT